MGPASWTGWASLRVRRTSIPTCSPSTRAGSRSGCSSTPSRPSSRAGGHDERSRCRARAPVPCVESPRRRPREEGWSYERFAEILLSTEVNARDSHGGEGRIKTARFPARKTLEEFDFTFQRSVKKTVIEHLGQLDFLHARENVILLGPPGTGKTHIPTALGIRACLAGQRVLFSTATQWVARLADAKRQGSLEAELKRLSFVPVLVVDEIGYIPFDPEAANLMFNR